MLLILYKFSIKIKINIKHLKSYYKIKKYSVDTLTLSSDTANAA